MAVSTQSRTQSQLAVPAQHRRRRTKSNQAVATSVAPGLKASLVGGLGIFFLMLIGLIEQPEEIRFFSLALLVIPGYLVVCLATGLLAGIFAGDSVTNSQQGGKVGWIAGFWSGIYMGIIAMILAAIGFSPLGIPIVNFGQGIVNQFSPEQLQTLTTYSLSADTIALTGRVFGVLIIVGVLGSLVSALLSSIGGMIYPKLMH